MGTVLLPPPDCQLAEREREREREGEREHLPPLPLSLSATALFPSLHPSMMIHLSFVRAVGYSVGCKRQCAKAKHEKESADSRRERPPMQCNVDVLLLLVYLVHHWHMHMQTCSYIPRWNCSNLKTSCYKQEGIVKTAFLICCLIEKANCLVEAYWASVRVTYDPTY